MEYLVIDSGKLYHHKMRLDSILRRQQVTRDDVLNYIKNKHFHYFINGKVKDAQVLKFIDRIMIRNGKGSPSILLAKQNQSNNSPTVYETKVEKVGPAEKDDFEYLNDDDE